MALPLRHIYCADLFMETANQRISQEKKSSAFSFSMDFSRGITSVSRMTRVASSCVLGLVGALAPLLAPSYRSTPPVASGLVSS